MKISYGLSAIKVKPFLIDRQSSLAGGLGYPFYWKKNSQEYKTKWGGHKTLPPNKKSKVAYANPI